MKKIGVIGLGGIAQKAYLPVFAALQDQYEWHLVTRNADKLNHLKAQYGFKHTSTDMDDLLQVPMDAVFIHTPTPTHYEIIKKFLEHKINVYVDKPISEDLNEVKELYALAQKQQVLLTCGFNRRFVPMHQQLTDIKNLHTVRVTKTREDELQDSTFAIFDLMIHVIDTAQFLMGSQDVNFDSGRIIQKDGQLIHAQTNLSKDTITGYASVDMQSQTNHELVELTSNQGLVRVNNLNETETNYHGTKQVTLSPDWQNNLVTRGFEPIIKAFLNAVDHNGENPVSPASDILAHELCVDLIKQAKVIEYNEE